MRDIKNAIIDPTILIDDFPDDYRAFIIEAKENIMPNRKLQHNIIYDLKCSPQDYLRGSLYMMKEIEDLDKKIYNVFPTRKDIAPKHFRIDTTTLIHLLFDKNDRRKGQFLTNGKTKTCGPYLWKKFFRTEMKIFRKTNYLFNHQIVTDGVSASIIFIKKEQFGKRCKRGVPKIKYPERYIHDLPNPLLDLLRQKQLVAIDPNMSDLLYCISFTDRLDTSTRKHLRYTQNQKRKETKQKKFSKILEKMKDEKIGNKNITEYETELSSYSRKCLDFSEYMKYIKAKNRLNDKVSKFYENEIHRKLKHQSFINRRKSEQKFINRFVEKFGTPENTIIGIGDWEQAKHMKYKEPVKGKGYRTMFRKAGFKVFLIDEHKSSCMCNTCEHRLEKFRIVKNPKPYRRDSQPTITSRGLLRCKSCGALWNRDENAARNQFDIAYLTIRKMGRPDYLKRGT